MGKTALVRELIKEDASHGICVFDTSGTLTETVPHDILFDPAHTRWNPFDEPIDRNLAPNLFANTIVDLMGHSGRDRPLWLINLQLNAQFLASAFIDCKRNLTGIPQFLLDAEYRAGMNILDDDTRQYWSHFEDMPPRDRSAHIASTYSLFSSVLLDHRVKRLLGCSKTKLSLADVSRRVMVVRLPIEEYGEDTVSFVGSLVLAYVRYLTPAHYSIYVDDANLFAPKTVERLATSGRQALTLSHQHLDQLSETVRAAVLGNSGQRFVFRVSQQDAEVLKIAMPPNSSKTALDRLAYHTYRRFPWEARIPDGETVPLEMY